MTFGSSARWRPYELPDFIGIPYERNGCSFEGCSCYGLVRLVYRHMLQIELPAEETLKLNAPYTEQSLLVRKQWVPVSSSDCQTYDVALIRAMQQPSKRGVHLPKYHLALYLHPQRLLHTIDSVQGGSRLERLSPGIWGSRILGYYRHIENCHV